ncbi:hypothetical protein M501DRAFT_982876 [Patellaria atrata CBS 101060]|uniref:Uncharacterized protein n=1 Tax=Patellaria atrata CBS 101060 TaxID=1346257 RepID=A0A9P4VMB7_9PEZI|nr:hypothetical protein M501DRAFT_982876 [Patellaria atrata CBS 101060]
MLRASRTAVPRTAIPRHAIRLPRKQYRYQSNTAGPDQPQSFHPALVGAITGSVVTFGLGYGYYHFSGAKQLVQTSNAVKSYFNQTTQKLKETTPEPNAALDWLKHTAKTYAAFIPGASGVVDAVFRDLDVIREKHGEEVDRIVSEAYDELRDVTKKGLNWQTAGQAWVVFQKHMSRIGDLAGDAAAQILDNHPQLKQQFGGSVDQLKEMSDNYGPEIKKQVDETWNQVADIVKGGLSAENIAKAKKLLEEKVEELRKLGDEAWKKGMEKAKPYLDKNPQVKKLVEKNADTLKNGNVGELVEKTKQAAESGDMSDLESYVNKAKDKASKATSGSGLQGLEGYFKQIPGASEILPKLNQLSEVAQKHGKDAEKLLKDTVNEIQQVLSKKSEAAKDLANKAEKESKS